MKNFIKYFLFSIVSLFTLVTLFGCQAQKQMQAKLDELEPKIIANQQRITALENELKKSSFEVTQIKTVTSKLGDVVVTLNRAEEERQKHAEEAAAKLAKKHTKKPPAKTKKSK